MAHDARTTSAFLTCKNLLARLVARMVPLHDVEDIVQETYVRVCSFKPAETVNNPEALMVTVAGNLARDYVRRAHTRAAVEDLENTADAERAAADDPPLEEQIDSQREFTGFCLSLRELSPQCRRAFVLKKIYGFSQAEVAQAMQISENTVEKHIARALRHCQQQRITVGLPAQGIHGGNRAEARARISARVSA